MGTASYRSRVKLGGTSTSFTEESVTYDADSGVYQIDDEYKRVWDPYTTIQGSKGDNDLVIEVDEAGDETWTEIDFSDIDEMNFLFGKFTLESDIDPESASQVRVTGKYIPISEGGNDRPDTRIAYCDSYDLALEGTVLDRTGFKEAQDTNGNRDKIIGLIDCNASLTGFGFIPDDIQTAFYDRDTVLLEIIPGNAEAIFRGWFVVETDSLSGDVDALETSDISFQLTSEYPEDRVEVSFGWSDVVMPTA